MKLEISAIGAAVAAALFASACVEDVPVPNDSRAQVWAPTVKSSYPDWQPPVSMPQGNADYEDAFAPASQSGEIVYREGSFIAPPSMNDAPEEAAPAEPQAQEPALDPSAAFTRIDVNSADGYPVNGAALEEKIVFDYLGRVNKEIRINVFVAADAPAAKLERLLQECRKQDLKNVFLLRENEFKPIASALESKPAAPRRTVYVVDPEGQATEYVVQQNDSLSLIAQKVYHDGALWGILANANKALLKGGPDKLRPGMKLKVPAIKVAR